MAAIISVSSRYDAKATKQLNEDIAKLTRKTRNFVEQTERHTGVSKLNAQEILNSARAMRDNTSKLTQNQKILSKWLKDIDNAPKEVKQLRTELEKLSKENDKQLNNTKDSTKASNSMTASLGRQVLAWGAAALSMQQFTRLLRDSLSASAEHESAMLSLEFALGRSSDGTKSQTFEFDLQAERLEKLTGISSDFILQQEAIALNMGANTRIAKLLGEASVDLAAALGRDVNQAALQLAKSLGGFAGELTESLPEVKTMTREQLLMGEAIELAASKYEGAAARIAKGVAGQKKIIDEQFADIKQGIGDLILEPTIRSTGTSGLADNLEAFGNTIQNIRAAIQLARSDGTLQMWAAVMAGNAELVGILLGVIPADRSFTSAAGATGLQAQAMANRMADIVEANVQAFRDLSLTTAEREVIRLANELKAENLRLQEAHIKILNAADAYIEAITDPTAIFRVFSAHFKDNIPEAIRLSDEYVAAQLTALEAQREVARLKQLEADIERDKQLARQDEELAAAVRETVGDVSRTGFTPSPFSTEHFESLDELMQSFSTHTEEAKDELESIDKAMARFLPGTLALVNRLDTTLGNAFADAIFEAQNFGDALLNIFRSVMQQLLADIAALGFKSLFSSLLNVALPGAGTVFDLATGRDSTGVIRLGEDSPMQQLSTSIDGLSTRLDNLEQGSTELNERQVARQLVRLLRKETAIAGERGFE